MVKRRIPLLALVPIALLLLSCVPAVLSSGSRTTPGTDGGMGSGGGTTGPVGWPTIASVTITRGYGCSDFFTGVHGGCGARWFHDGVDFANTSRPPLYAVTDMRIDYAGPDSSSPMDCSGMAGSEAPHNGAGIYVKGTDANGTEYFYFHTTQVYVTAGEQVRAGQEIAQMGSTGCSTGAHLHLRVVVHGQTIDPMTILTQP